MRQILISYLGLFSACLLDRMVSALIWKLQHWFLGFAVTLWPGITIGYSENALIYDFICSVANKTLRSHLYIRDNLNSCPDYSQWNLTQNKLYFFLSVSLAPMPFILLLPYPHSPPNLPWYLFGFQEGTIFEFKPTAPVQECLWQCRT